jgi:hypothetical protein
MIEKVKKVPLNRLVLPETFEKVKELAVSCDLTDGGVIDRAVRLFYVHQTGGVEVVESGADERLDEVLEHLRALPQTFQEAMDEYKARKTTTSVVASTLPAPKQGIQEEELPFHPRCLHCGENFGAWNRNASLCTDCKVARHSGDPARCDICTAGTAI